MIIIGKHKVRIQKDEFDKLSRKKRSIYTKIICKYPNCKNVFYVILSNFQKNMGKYKYCNECSVKVSPQHKEAMKRYRAKNKQKYRTYQKNYQRKYRQDNREKLNFNQRKYYFNRKNEVNENDK